MSNWENEVFDATVGSFVELTMEKWGSSLADQMEQVVPAMQATEIGIEAIVTAVGPDGKAEFKRRTSTIVWRSEEQLAALEAELDAEETAEAGDRA